jgi:hypothetical protein
VQTISHAVDDSISASHLGLVVNFYARPNLKQYLSKLEEESNSDTGAGASNKFALGNILLANGIITRAELTVALRQQLKTGRRIGEELRLAGHVSEHDIVHGMLMQRKLVAYAMAISAGLLPLVPLSTPAEAAQQNASLQVSVTVVANAKTHTEYQATEIRISATDVLHGYVKVPSASRFSVNTNSRSGFMLEFHVLNPLFGNIDIDGLGNTVHIGAEGGAFVQRGASAHSNHELSFRFTLPRDVRPGTYPWPLQFSVRAL